jgi:transcriptional regulator with XRE-family HTH domain
LSNIGLNLKQLRKSSGQTQAELAVALAVSRSTVVLMEQGKRNVRAQEIEALASIFGCSTASLFAEAGPDSLSGDESGLLAEMGQALAEVGQQPVLQDRLEHVLKIAATLTDFEARLGLDGASLGPHSYDLSPPETAWEATQQGILAAAEERRRLNLGNAPIRDVDETLASNRIRMTKTEMPANVSGLFLNSRQTGFLLIVNRAIPVERRRFQFAHGYAHVLFDRNHRCLTCRTENRHDFCELRASAFAIRFLLPETGARRYLESLSKETLGRSAGGELELYAEPYRPDREEKRIRVPGRGRRGAEPISYCDLVMTAWFYGVTPSMAAGVFRNLRYITKEQFEQMDEFDEATSAMPVKEALGLPEHHVESGRDAFRSRLLALSVESLNRSLITEGEFLEATTLVELGDDQREALLSQVSTRTQGGKGGPG